MLPSYAFEAKLERVFGWDILEYPSCAIYESKMEVSARIGNFLTKTTNTCPRPAARFENDFKANSFIGNIFCLC